jgi:hypothetical protein
MNWKPNLGTIYCIADKTTNKVNLFYEVVELKTTHNSGYNNEQLHITYKVYDYRNGKNVNIYYVKLDPLNINDTHKKKDLTIYFQYRNGEDKLATHTITDAKRPKIWKTTEDTKATTTKLNKLLITHIYLCKHNAFTSSYSVENFYTLYNILYDSCSPFSSFMCPRDALYNKMCNDEYKEYNYNEYDKQKFTEICGFKYIFDKLSSPNIDDEDNQDSEEEEEEEEEEPIETAETADEEITMY